MIRDITLGQYYPGDSWIHKLDARIKIIWTFVYIISLFLIRDFWGYIAVFVTLALVIGISKVPVKFIMKGLKPIFLIILFTFTINMFMTPGTPIYEIWFLTITREGLYNAVFMGIRLILLIIGSSLLTLATKPINLTDGIEKLLSPGQKIGLPAHELAMMMTIALRFIPTLLEETDRIMKAQSSRGADFTSGNLWQKAKGMVPLLVPLFISAFRRADDLATAMEARCYRGGEGRTKMHQLAYTSRDRLAFITVFLVTAVLLAMYFYFRT